MERLLNTNDEEFYDTEDSQTFQKINNVKILQ